MKPQDYGKWTIVYPYYQESDHYWVKGWIVPKDVDEYYYYLNGKLIQDKRGVSIDTSELR